MTPPFRLDTCAKRWPQARHLRLASGADLRLDRPPAAAGGTGGTAAAGGTGGTAAAGGGTGGTAGTGGTGGTGGLQGVPPHLESLCLVGCLERPSALLLSPLAALAPTLRRLELCRCPVGDGAAALAATLRQLTALQSLTLSQNALDDPHAVCQAMCGGELAGLTELSFTGEPGDAEAVAAALPSAAARLRSLRLSLGMGRCGAVAVAPALSRLTALRTLDLRGNRLGNTDTQSDLDQLAGTGIGAPGASGMAALAPAIACLTSLDTLGLSYNGLRAAVGLLPLEALSGLTCLDLQSNDLKGAGRQLAGNDSMVLVGGGGSSSRSTSSSVFHSPRGHRKGASDSCPEVAGIPGKTSKGAHQTFCYLYCCLFCCWRTTVYFVPTTRPHPPPLVHLRLKPCVHQHIHHQCHLLRRPCPSCCSPLPQPPWCCRCCGAHAVPPRTLKHATTPAPDAAAPAARPCRSRPGAASAATAESGVQRIHHQHHSLRLPTPPLLLLPLPQPPWRCRCCDSSTWRSTT